MHPRRVDDEHETLYCYEDHPDILEPTSPLPMGDGDETDEEPTPLDTFLINMPMDVDALRDEDECHSNDDDHKDCSVDTSPHHKIERDTSQRRKLNGNGSSRVHRRSSQKRRHRHSGMRKKKLSSYRRRRKVRPAMHRSKKNSKLTHSRYVPLSDPFGKRKPTEQVQSG